MPKFISFAPTTKAAAGVSIALAPAQIVLVQIHRRASIDRVTARASIQALVTSGLRCVYCYAPPFQVKSWSPFSGDDETFSPWVMDGFKSLAAAGPYGKGRVTIGFALDNIYTPAEVIKPYYATLRDAGAQVITTHATGGPITGYRPSALQLLDSHGLLGKDVLLSHANFPKDDDAAILRKSGASISTTPNTELQMGYPLLALRPEFEGHASLGVDCHSWGTASMPTQMRMQLQSARLERANEMGREGKWSRHVGPKAEQVFNLATIGGAKAIGMSDQLGKIAVGMKADLVVFDGASPAMAIAAQQDPVAAIVLHSSPRDVEMVIIDGIIRKEYGRLLDVQVSNPLEGSQPVVETGKVLSWKSIVGELLKSRKRLNAEAEKHDLVAAQDVMMRNYFMATQNMVENDKA